MVLAKNRTTVYVAAIVVVSIVVGPVLLAIEGRPVNEGSIALDHLRDSHVFNGRVMSSVKPVEPSLENLSWLATVKKSGPSPGIGHHRGQGYKKYGRARDSGPSPGVGH
ncbi:unnamed protein product [Cochlearia groenlandica]